MAFPTFLSSLQNTLSPHARILTNPSHPDFKRSLRRWSNIDLQVPGAIIQPADEEDAVKTVAAAIEASIPFVPSCGGHSLWSTVGTEGFILDLSLYKDVEVDAGNATVVVKGGILMKEMTTALADAGQFAPFGSGNTVGVIPYYIGGGVSMLTSVCGFASDNIVSARMITAEGTLVNADAENNPDLLWALKGAGQFFGVVTELKIRTQPLSLLGRDGEIWAGSYVFPVERAQDVCAVMEPIMLDETHPTVGHLTVVALPWYLRAITPSSICQGLLVVSSNYLGAPENGPAAFQSLKDLGPLRSEARMTAYRNLADHLEYLCAQGDYKRFSPAGIREFKTENFLQVIDIHLRLLKECPDAAATAYHFQWHSRMPKSPTTGSAMGHHDVQFWLNCLSWYTNARSHDKVLRFEQEALAAMRVGQNEADFVDYQGVNRVGPIERRYRGTERLAKLRRLKQDWDPTPVFTTQLL